MNFDANTIATLMQLLNPDKQAGNAENNAYNAQKPLQRNPSINRTYKTRFTFKTELASKCV